MIWQANPYVPPLLLAASIVGGLAIFVWRRRAVPGALPTALLMLAVMAWSLTYALELGSASLDAKVFWAKAQYAAFLAIPTLWLIFTLYYTSREYQLARRTLALLAAIPLATLLLVWTNDAHGLIYQETSLDTSQPYTMLMLTYGPGFWIQGTFAYTLFFLGTLLILRAFRDSRGPYRRQAAALLIAGLVPLLANILYILQLSPFPNLDLTPFGFAIAGIVAVYAMFRYRFLDLTPVARTALVDTMSDGVIVLDAQDRIVDLNRASQLLVGVPPTTAVGQSAGALIPGWSDLQDRHRPPRSDRAELHLERDGSQHTYDLRMTPLFDQRGQHSGRLLVGREITDRIQMQQAERTQRATAEALRDATAALTSTLSLEEVLDRILTEVVRVVPHDTSAIMLIQNGVARVVRSHGFEEMGQGDWITALSLSIDDTPNLRLMLETEAPLAIANTKGHPNWIEMPDQPYVRSYAGAPIRSKGHVIGFLNLTSARPGFYKQAHAQQLQAFADQAGVAIENARLVASLQKTNAELSMTMRSKDELIQNVSHELRTPLTLLSGYIEFLQDTQLGPLTSDQEKALQLIHQQTERLRLMVDSLLVLQAFDARQLRPAPLDLATWLPMALAPWHHRAARAGIQLSAHVPPDLPPIMVDGSYFKQAVDNLLDNAIKFSPDGGSIRLSAQHQGDVVEISFADQGIGIAADQLELIFQRFFQVDGTTTRPFGGMGIGLALCRTIVEAHGGHIWADSPGVNRGSTFHVSLPVASQPSDNVTSQAAHVHAR